MPITITAILVGCTDWERFSHDFDADRACATYVVAGDVHSCARTATGALYCWGDNRFGQLGLGDTAEHAGPTRVSVNGLATLKIYVPTGNGDITSDLTAFTCAIVEGDDLWCWGDNRFGQLGLGNTESTPTPKKVDGLPSKPSRVTNGAGHTCVQGIDGALTCFGKNTQGQLGVGDREQRNAPVKIDIGRPGVAIERLAAGAEFTCARGTDATLSCWGANGSGQLGIGSIEAQSLKPVLVQTLGARVGRFAAGAAHICTFTEDDGQVHCWGDNRAGQLGTGDTERRLIPTGPIDPKNLGAVRTNQLFAGGVHTCALRDDNTLWCWGGNRFGQLGTGNTDPRTTPVQVMTNVAAAYAGAAHTCALSTTGEVSCWGNNQYGQLGVPTRPQSLTPVTVLRACQQ